MSRTVQITFDAADPNGLAGFWNEVLGYTYQPAPAGFDSWDDALDQWGVPEADRNMASASIDPDDRGPRLFFQRVPEGKTAKNRVHLDVRAAPGIEGGNARMTALEAECERLVALGGTRVRRSEPAPPLSQGFIVMEDPEGNVFCLD